MHNFFFHSISGVVYSTFVLMFFMPDWARRPSDIDTCANVIISCLFGPGGHVTMHNLFPSIGWGDLFDTFANVTISCPFGPGVQATVHNRGAMHNFFFHSISGVVYSTFVLMFFMPDWARRPSDIDTCANVIISCLFGPGGHVTMHNLFPSIGWGDLFDTCANVLISCPLGQEAKWHVRK